MTILDEIGPKKEHLVDVLIKYSEIADRAEKNIVISGKTLEECNVEQPKWQAYYDDIRVQLHTVKKYMDSEVSRVRGTLWKSYTETNDMLLSPKDKEQYINHEPAYLDTYKLYLEVLEVHDKYESIVEAYRARGFALRNITNLRVASLENILL